MATSEALATRGQVSLSQTSTDDPARVTEWLKNQGKDGHLVSPATTCPNLPLGCEVAFSAVLINVGNSKEAYPIPGSSDLGLSKTSINRIANAAGVSWDPLLSCKTDDGKDPFLYSFKAVGFYRDFDGTVREIHGEKTMDLREDSATVVGIRRRQKDEPGKADREITQLRMFIGEHAETKAKNRALRGGLALQTSYTKAELGKPFVVAKLMFTGRVSDADDPTGEIRRIHADNIGKAMLGGATALFGTPRQPIHEISPPIATQAQIGAGTQPETSVAEAATVEPWIIPFGEHKDKPISDDSVPDSVLSALLDYYLVAKEDVDNADKVEQFTENMKRIHAEIDRRMQSAPKGEQGDLKL